MVSGGEETSKTATMRNYVAVTIAIALFFDSSGQMGALTGHLGTSSWPILSTKVS